ncbi:MAG: 30S ribosomal protein S3 [Candidatus Peribacteria bacterium]|jgi:small subunit ribosomal protein S3|nr:30S ribosomal protein S3 [Candidatus Peribacteria bacterium]GHV26400.1 30S ribosomal protein S3 [Bacteroidia bacterium]
MGQKVNPVGMRVGIMKSRPSEWFAKSQRQGADFFIEDIQMRNFIDKSFPRAGISKVILRKTAKEGEVILFATKVGVIMGKNGDKIKEVEKKLKEKFHKDFKINVKEVRTPELSARVMAEFIATQIENRMPYRKVIKNTVSKIMEKGADGVKVQIGGRLNGADIARTEHFIDGRVSLQTFRSDIDYHYLQAMTKYGVLGIKVWIQKGTQYSSVKKNKKPVLE